MTVNDFMNEMQADGIFMTDEMTFYEYVEHLVKFQDVVTKLCVGEEYVPEMRLEEAIFRMEGKARELGVRHDPVVRKGIAALKTANKELCVSLSGKYAEDLVSKTLQYVSRPELKVYRNVYLADEEDETELDSVLVTSDGILILEIKKSRDDLTFSPDGRLLHSGDECYEKKSTGKKMKLKRRMLKERLENMAKEQGIELPISVDSIIVITTPKGVRIQVEDMYRKERWCFRTGNGGLTDRIESYSGIVSYSEGQMQILNEMLSQIETDVKRFPLPADFDEILRDIAEALVILLDTEVKERECIQEEQKEKYAKCADEIRVENKNRKMRKKPGIFAVRAALLAGVFCAGTLVGLSLINDKSA